MDDLQAQFDSLQQQFNQLKEIYYKTHNIDKDIFQNPVFFKGKMHIPVVTAVPTSTPDKGSMVYNTGDNKLYIFNGSVWKKIALT